MLVRLVLAPGVRAMEVDDGAVLFEPGGPQYMDLNEGGAGMWRALVDGGFDPDSVREWLVSANGVDEAQAGSLVDDFVDSLLTFGFIVRS